MITTVYKFEAQLQDVIKLTQEFTKAKLELKGLKKETEEYAAAQAKLKGISGQLKNATNEMRKTEKATNQLNKSGLNLINTFKSAAVAIAAAFAFRAIVGGLKSIVTTFRDFEAQMAAVKAISGATAAQFKELEESAMKYGRTTVFTATQVAQLQEEFARLGFTTDEIISATKATLDLAAATGESLANSAQIAGSTLRAYGMDAMLTKEVTDTMAAAFTSSALNLDAFTESMKFVAPVAKATGFTLQETTAILANLADNGIRGSIAGNSLKNILLKLSDSNSKLAKKIGGPIQGIDELGEAMLKLKEQGFGATEAVELLDKRAAPAFLALMQNIDGLEESIDVLNDAEGATSKMAAIRLDTLQGDMTLLKSASEGLAIALGEEFDLSLRNIIYSFTNFIKAITESDWALSLIKNGLKAAAVVLTFFLSRMAVAGVISFARGIKSAATALLTYRTATTSATAATNSFTASLARNPIGAFVVLLSTAISALVLFQKETGEAELKQRRLNEAIREELDAVLEIEQGTSKRAAAMRELKDEMGELAELVDIEIANDQELIEIRSILKSQEGRKEEIAGLKDSIAVNKDWLAENQKALESANERMEIERDYLIELDKEEGAYGRNSDAIAEYNRKIDVHNKKINARLNPVKAAEKEIDALEASIQRQIEASLLFQNKRLRGEDSYRKQQQEYYDEELKAFRNLQGEEANAFIEKNEKLLQEMTWTQEYADLLVAMEGATGEILVDLEAKMKNLKEESAGFNLVSSLNSRSVQKLGVDLSLLNSFVSKLGGVINDTTTEFTEMEEVAGIKLRKTKDAVDELFDALVDGINDVATREQISLTADFTQLQVDLNTQRDEIKANLEDIQSLIEEGDAARIVDTLKLSRNKLDILKNMNDEEFQQYQKTEEEISAMTEEERTTFGKKLNNLLQELYWDDLNNLNSVNDAKLKSQETYDNQYAENEIQNQNEANSQFNQAQQNRILDLDAANAMELVKQTQSEFALFKNYKAMRELRVAAVQASLNEIKRVEKADIKEQDDLLEQGKITEEQHAANVLRIKSKAANDGVKIVKEGLDEEVAAQEQALEKIKEYYSMAFDALSTYMTNRFELQRQEITEERDAEKEDMNAEMEAELEMFEGNAAAQEDIREVYAMRQDLLERKKQAELRKIAKKEWQMEKANDIIMATINGALAITKVAAQTGVGAVAAVPVMAALTGAQIAAIAAQKFVGAKGGIIPDDKFADGGMVYGPSHAQGGVKFNAGGRVVELEGGEAVINKRSTAMFKPQLSAMNAAGGGKRFAEGGIAGALQSTATSSSNMGMEDLARNIVNGINNKTVTVSESDITSTQENVSVSELTASIF